MKILLFGGSGLLGSELKRIYPDIECPSSSMVDVCDYAQVESYIHHYQPSIVINSAACLNNNDIDSLIHTNIIGSANIASICEIEGIRYIYISTDYVYKGDRGNYSEKDLLFPFNYYAWSKLGGECSAQVVKNSLIIRTTFGSSNFPYDVAYVDKYVSKGYVDEIAPMILEAATSELLGVINIGLEKKTIYEYARLRNKNVTPISLDEAKFKTPKDTSMNTTKWEHYKKWKK